jgi:putative tryptophan/tyrosine transport system substrate-binding protein
MRRREFISRVPGAAQHERSEVMRCRPGTVTNSEHGTVPDQRCTTRAAHSRCTASGTREMGRREFMSLLGGAAAAWPLAARAQQGERVRRIAVLNNVAEGDPDIQAWIGAFRQRLDSLGWREGLKIDIRWGAGDLTRLRRYAAELVSTNPDVAFADSTPSISALQQATRTIPIVFVGGSNPVGSGFVASLARPEGNITGFISFEPAIGGKWLGTLKEIAPRVTRAALIYNPQTHTGQYFQSIEAAAQSLGVELVRVAFHEATDIERGIDDFARARGMAACSCCRTPATSCIAT